MRVNGRCHCGKITFQASVDPKDVNVCHCTDCQVLSGSPFRVSVFVPSADFKLQSGEPKIYVKTAEEGEKRAQGFCADCGTPLYSAALQNTPGYFVRLGSLAERAQLPPQKQIWCRSALPWTQGIHGLPGLERD